MATWKPPETTGDLDQIKVHQDASIGASPRLPSEHFTHLGRQWRLFKRTADKNSSWYFQVKKSGKAFPTSLKTSALKPAVEKARLLVDAAHSGKLAEMRAVLAGRPETAVVRYCTCVQYLAEYESTATGENKEKSRKQAVQAFKRLAGEELPATMAQLAPMFKAARSRVNVAIEAAADNATKMSKKRSFNSELASAGSVFSEMAVFSLKDHLTLPDFIELRSLVKFLRFTDAKKTTDQFNPPTAEILAETIKQWATLPRNEFIAVGLALSCGMRRGEIKIADWSWFEEHAGYVWVNARKGDFKDRTDMLRAQVLNPFYVTFLAFCLDKGWIPTNDRGERAGLMITGNKSEFDRNISDWMTKLGWNTRLHLHALRAWAGSLVYMKYGAAAACEFCRHANEKTTKEHYGWMKQDWHTADAAVMVAGKPVQWMKAVTRPSPKGKL